MRDGGNCPGGSAGFVGGNFGASAFDSRYLLIASYFPFALGADDADVPHDRVKIARRCAPAQRIEDHLLSFGGLGHSTSQNVAILMDACRNKNPISRVIFASKNDPRSQSAFARCARNP
jgi:hypothetical protein